MTDLDADLLASTARAELPDSMNAALEQDAAPRWRPFVGFSLFWRTFFLLVLLLLGSAFGWYELFVTLEYEPRVLDNAHQVVSLLNLSRAALTHPGSDASARASLIKTLADQEGMRILPHAPGDKYTLLARTDLEQRISRELTERLGPGTVVASEVNGEPGRWVGLAIEGDSYWLLMNRSHIGTLLGGSAWLLWLATLSVVSLIGAALLARLINRPLQQLSIAAARLREGDDPQRLDENASASEVRAVNIGFNRMAEQLSKVERERTEMLAGISHDLRTPLARLRLEIEMSVPDPDARGHMAADIAQADIIIEKFLDYARPNQATLQSLPLADLVHACALPFIVREDMQVRIDIPHELRVMADEIELSRVLANLLENARRYGQTPGTSVARVRLAATVRGRWVTLRVRDYGPGVTPELLPNVTRPFYRGDSARTSATGTGLGLAIVAKMMQNMGGILELRNSPSGGLMVLVRLLQAAEPPPQVKKRRGAR